MSKEGLILLVDDDPNTRKVARANLPLDGFEVLVASSGTEALAGTYDTHANLFSVGVSWRL